MTAICAANQTGKIESKGSDWSRSSTLGECDQPGTYCNLPIQHFCTTYHIQDFAMLITARNKGRGREEFLLKANGPSGDVKTKQAAFADWRLTKCFENTYTPVSFKYFAGHLTLTLFESDRAEVHALRDPRERALFEQLNVDAGYCIPVVNGKGDHALALITLETMPQSERLGSLYFKLVKIFETISISASSETERMAGRLTNREIECLKWVADGKTSLEIAAITSLSVHTINHYLKICCSKLNTVNRIQAAVVAARQELI